MHTSREHNTLAIPNIHNLAGLLGEGQVESSQGQGLWKEYEAFKLFIIISPTLDRKKSQYIQSIHIKKILVHDKYVCYCYILKPSALPCPSLPSASLPLESSELTQRCSMLSPRGFSLQSIPDKNKIELRKININFYDYTQDKKIV